MKHFKNLREAYSVFNALGSPVRLEILEYILENKTANLDTLAKNLHLTNGALTKHIKLLESAGVVHVRQTAGKRGNQKSCSIKLDKLIVDISPELNFENVLSHDIPLGLYCDYTLNGVCGIVGTNGFIGSRDDIASFLSPSRADASAIWFKSGSLTYMLPTFRDINTIQEIRLAFEISSDYTGSRQESSLLSFFLDGKEIGSYTLHYTQSEKRRGFLTPQWFDDYLPQYGTLRLIRITKKGTFMDGEKISSFVLPQSLPSRFTIATNDGVMLFGKNFGDHSQSIRYSIQTD